MTYQITTPIAGFQPIAVTDTTQNHALGTIVTAEDETYGQGEFIYLTGVASTAVGDVVIIDQGTTVRAVAGSRGPVAVAMSANVANQYGWYQISGRAVVKTAGSVADNALVYATATAGSVDDAVVSGDKVDGAVFRAAGTGATTVVAVLDRPALNGNG
jgi:hypothetical protein